MRIGIFSLPRTVQRDGNDLLSFHKTKNRVKQYHFSKFHPISFEFKSVFIIEVVYFPSQRIAECLQTCLFFYDRLLKGGLIIEHDITTMVSGALVVFLSEGQALGHHGRCQSRFYSEVCQILDRILLAIALKQSYRSIQRL